MKQIILTILTSLMSASAFAGGALIPLKVEVTRYQDGAILCSVTNYVGTDEETLFRCPVALQMNVNAKFTSAPGVRIGNGDVYFFADLSAAIQLDNGAVGYEFIGFNERNQKAVFHANSKQGIVTITLTPDYRPKQIEL
ncbi:hypothetical protein DOM22_08755 [Bdellovibrio sp. ZAP7]|uniref:hypothetical protein n=1 Tax=Bdellovibrio sp. ZAP7 TaxID=2231053 RepID=UPI00115C1B7A|nr:hypothetical protein [Bdellovibrio sp. ZAP7]QDK45238.1 hypothetical protein DOM22_08755 [Bdellovibrio sp. ZAP7]